MHAEEVAQLEFLEHRSPSHMTDTELLQELVLGQREMRALVRKFVADMDSNPMMKTMARMFGGR